MANSLPASALTANYSTQSACWKDHQGHLESPKILQYSCTHGVNVWKSPTGDAGLWVRTTSMVLRSRMQQTHKEKKPVLDWFHLGAKLSLSQPFSVKHLPFPSKPPDTGSHSLQAESTFVSPAVLEARERICELPQSSAEVQHLLKHISSSPRCHMCHYSQCKHECQHTELCNFCLPTLEQELITTKSREMCTILE